MDIESLNLLETKIDSVLRQHGAVCEERNRLTQELEQSQERVHHLTAQLARAEKEREEVKSRVEKILERINGLDLG